MDISRILPLSVPEGQESLLGGLEYFLDGLILAGAILLIASIIPAHRLTAQLPSGRLRRNWRVLMALTCVFFCGYLSYVFVNWNGNFGNDRSMSHYLLPVVYFLCACFVHVLNNFALETMGHIRSVTVLDLENITDPMLGIHNRRYLDHRLKQEVVRAVRYHLPLSVVLIDIDHFNEINGKYGRQAGDNVLAGLVKVILNTARNTDIIARYGGEEIMIVATNTPVTGTVTFSERLRKTIEETVRAQLSSGEEIRVTVSIGVAAVGPETGTVKALTESVIDALSRAKAQGRNIVMVNKSDAGAV
jgi:diguanylate cyclase (GGDEF)-like protein